MLHLFEFHNNGLILYTVFHDDIEIEPLTPHAWGVHHPIHQFFIDFGANRTSAEWSAKKYLKFTQGQMTRMSIYILYTYSDFVYLYSYKILVS